MNYDRNDVESIVLPKDMPRSQTSEYERKLLYWLASSYYSGIGDIVDAGCLVGGSTFHFLRGLRDNINVDNKIERIHAYDYFPGKNFDEFENNLLDYKGMYRACKGDLAAFKSPNFVEILFIDIAKTIDT